MRKIGGGCGPTHILGKGLLVVQIGGAPQLQLMSMSAKYMFNFMLINKTNQS